MITWTKINTTDTESLKKILPVTTILNDSTVFSFSGVILIYTRSDKIFSARLHYDPLTQEPAYFKIKIPGIDYSISYNYAYYKYLEIPLYDVTHYANIDRPDGSRYDPFRPSKDPIHNHLAVDILAQVSDDLVAPILRKDLKTSEVMKLYCETKDKMSFTAWARWDSKAKEFSQGNAGLEEKIGLLSDYHIRFLKIKSDPHIPVLNICATQYLIGGALYNLDEYEISHILKHPHLTWVVCILPKE